jgi:hypothetical protein
MAIRDSRALRPIENVAILDASFAVHMALLCFSALHRRQAATALDATNGFQLAVGSASAL